MSKLKILELLMLVTALSVSTISIATALPMLTTIEVSPSSTTLNVNGSQMFNATALDQNNTPMEGIDMDWTVSDSSVGEINPVNSTTDANGISTAIFNASANGSTIVSATNETIFGTANVTVVAISPQTKGKIWNVTAGVQTPDMSIQTMGFYPGIITINVGDTITWNLGGGEPHTVSFLSGNPSPVPGSPDSFAPAGNITYNGTGITSSGILLPGNNYSLTFTNAGIFIYQCLLHPGMQGVVIVQNAGSPYPFTQAQYTSQGKDEGNADIATGNSLVANLSVKSSPGPNNTTIWNALIDIPLPENVSVALAPNESQTDNNTIGISTLEIISPGNMSVDINANGLVSNSTNSANIRAGTCNSPGAIVYPLNDMVADANGTASNTTTVTGVPWLAIATRGWSVSIEGSNGTVSCGDVVKHDAGFVRFTPPTLNIAQGDQVIWTQTNPMLIHTVSFLDKNQTPPELLLPGPIINPVVANKSGDNSYNGTGFYNSGILQGGQTYSLTFTNNGTFNYLCLIHDELNMTGVVNVAPAGQPIPTPITGLQISGKVFNDANDNGILDEGEQGLEGWKVTLSGLDENTHAFVRLKAITDSDGNYGFADVPEGNFVLRESKPADWISTTKSIMSVAVPGKNVKVNFGNINVEDRTKLHERTE